MPIFQDDLIDRGRSVSPLRILKAEPMRRQESEESIRTDLCEGPLLEDSMEMDRAGSAMVPGSERASPEVFDRVELMKRLKRGESPTWMPNKHLGKVLQQIGGPTQLRTTTPNVSSTLLPAAEIQETTKRHVSAEYDQFQAGLSIERPRSALHSGDFTEKTGTNHRKGVAQDSVDSSPLFTPAQPSWCLPSSPRDLSSFRFGEQSSSRTSLSRPDFVSRARAPSLSSLSSSFAFRAPTSPLVQSESNDDLDLGSSVNSMEITSEVTSSFHRHAFQNFQFPQGVSSSPTSLSYNRPLQQLRRDHTYPYQAHQPKRSLQGHSGFDSLPQTPELLRSRRPSYASESSPLQLTSMVGSYEESILRGRMSTAPSRPLDFVAQIGVLGLGKCKANLRCPAHVTLPFPAVFYSYATTSHGRNGKSEDGPSPYVGQIDLESGLPHLDSNTESKRKRRRSPERRFSSDINMADLDDVRLISDRDHRRAQKQKRRSTSPRAPPGGSYRIPEKGQLQIIIKNPNKTAVKLFLVPYDLVGMEPGTKTFIRQRSYSVGSIIESSTALRPQDVSNLGDRPTLRYLVHLHICSPSRGRFYLYKSIRVVFANRVPDGKEKLRNEIQLPEPRFSVYKPGRESHLGPIQSSTFGAGLTAEKAFRRRSAGFALTSRKVSDSMPASINSSEIFFSNNFSTTPVEAIPSNIFTKNVSSADLDYSLRQSDMSNEGSQIANSPALGEGSSWSGSNTTIESYNKLNKGDVGYGGNVFASVSYRQKSGTEGLLAMKLKELGVGKDQESPPSN